MYSADLYVKWYEMLSHEHDSKEANQNLITLEQSSQCWGVAKQLISSPHQIYQKHGSQLLSKRLNKPYTIENQNQLQLTKFIFSLPHIPNLLYYCLAKIYVHLNLEKVYVEAPHNTLEDVLRILKYIPEAGTKVFLYRDENVDLDSDNEKMRVRRIYNSHKQMLIEALDEKKYHELVLECLRSMTDESFEIESVELVRFLLKNPIEEVHTILETVMMNEKYPELNDEILNYLVLESSSQKVEYFYPIFLEFAKNISCMEIQQSLLEFILGKILMVMNLEMTLPEEERKNVFYIANSFDFWMQMKEKIIRHFTRKPNDKDEEEENMAPQKLPLDSVKVKMCCQAFVEVWKIVIGKCVLKSIPSFKERSDPLSLDGYDEDNEQQSLNKFRSTGEDFLLMCYNFSKKNDEMNDLMLKHIFELGQSESQIQLQLAIFILASLIDMVSVSEMSKVAEVIKAIVTNPNATNPYIWQQLLKLIGNFHSQVLVNADIILNALMVIKESLKIPQLSILACDSLKNFIEAVSSSNSKEQLTPMLNQFLDYLIENCYFEGNLHDRTDASTFEKKTNCFIFFIENFKHVTDFQQFLSLVHSKWDFFPNNHAKCLTIENLVLSHLFVKKEISAPFTSVLSDFCYEHIKQLQESIETCDSSNRAQLKECLFRIANIVNGVSGFRSHVWAEFVFQILSIAKKNEEALSFYLSPSIKFLKVEVRDEESYLKTVGEFVKSSEPLITNLLLTCDRNYSLIENALNFHLSIIQNYLEQVSTFYNPNTILNFICNSVLGDKSFTEYAVLRTSLAYLRQVISLNYEIQAILEKVLFAMNRLFQSFWNSIQSILDTGYKKGGAQVYHNVFSRVMPDRLPPNKFFEQWCVYLENSEGKKLKNLIASM